MPRGKRNPAQYTAGKWSLNAHLPSSDYHPAHTLWPQGIIISGLTRGDAELIEQAPKHIELLGDLADEYLRYGESQRFTRLIARARAASQRFEPISIAYLKAA